MIKEKFFYSIVRYNDRRPSLKEFYPLLDHIQFGDEVRAYYLLDYVNKKVMIEGGTADYQVLKINFEEI